MALLRKLTYDVVQAPIDRFYVNGVPTVMAANVPENAWFSIEIIERGPRITARFKQLMTQASQGALIRNIKIFESSVEEPVYTDVTAIETAAIVPPLPPPPVIP